MTLRILLMTVFCVITLTAGLSADAKTDQLLADVQKKYDTLKSVCADFTQTFHWKLTGETQVIKGKICVREGDQFKIDTPDQFIVTDGKTLWTLNKVNNQVVIDHPENSSGDNPFIKNFLTKYLTEYSAQPGTDEAEPGITCVRLTSKTGEHFVPQLKLWIDEKSKLIYKVEQADVNDNTTIFQIESIDTAAQLLPRDFVFTSPDGADVIDMR
jgi:chaperone LolA